MAELTRRLWHAARLFAERKRVPRSSVGAIERPRSWWADERWPGPSAMIWGEGEVHARDATRASRRIYSPLATV
jgi:hypothetical protein